MSEVTYAFPLSRNVINRLDPDQRDYDSPSSPSLQTQPFEHIDRSLSVLGGMVEYQDKGIRKEFGNIDERFKEVQTDVKNVQTDVKNIQTDINTINERLLEMGTRRHNSKIEIKPKSKIVEYCRRTREQHQARVGPDCSPSSSADGLSPPSRRSRH
jgi:hypothetical protein